MSDRIKVEREWSLSSAIAARAMSITYRVRVLAAGPAEVSDEISTALAFELQNAMRKVGADTRFVLVPERFIIEAHTEVPKEWYSHE